MILMFKDDKFIDDKIKDISNEKVVLDVGGGARFQKWLAEYEEMFRDVDYKTMDYDDRTGADVVGDIHAIPLDDESVDAVICSSVLEHVENPAKAVSEMRRILKSNGKIFVYVPSIYPYHARKGSYQDYWRFFDDTLEILFKDFKEVEIVKRGGYFRALSMFFPLQHRLQFILRPLACFLDMVFQTEKRTTTAGYYIYATK